MKQTLLRLLLLLLAEGVALPAAAQLNGHNLRGDYGLLAGTQPGPGWYAGLLYANLDIGEIRRGDGEKLPFQGNLDVNAVAPYLWWVSNFTFLGGTYSVFVTPSAVDNALEAPALGIDSDTGLGMGDLYLQPINLGWHTRRADYMAGLGVNVPTGKYEDGGEDNTGLGMWTYEVFGGTTFYFDEDHSWHFAALAFYATHSSKENSNVQVGDLLTIEGGLGKSWAGGALSAGIAYFAQWKMTSDDLSPEVEALLPDLKKHEIFGVGPEVVLPLATKKKFYGSVNLRYFWDIGVKNNSQGNTFVFMATFPIPSVVLQ